MTLSQQFEATQRAKRDPGMFRMPANREERAMARACDGLKRAELDRLADELRDADVAHVAAAVNEALRPLGRAVGA